MNAGIRKLILHGRINATSVMLASPHFNSNEATALDTLNSGEKRAGLGLHVTLTAPFSPMSADFSPLRKGRFLSLNDVLRGAVARRLQSELLITEIATQLGLSSMCLVAHRILSMVTSTFICFLRYVMLSSELSRKERPRPGSGSAAAPKWADTCTIGRR